MAKRKAASIILTNKTCKQMTDLVYDYINDSLSRKVKRDFERHLSTCPDCISFFNTYKKTVVTTRSLDAETLPPKVRHNVLAFLRKRARNFGAFLLAVAVQLAV